MITLRTLGECLVEVDGVSYGPDADTVFAALVYLAAERGRQLRRQQFADLFWPRITPERARHSLRQLLYRLRALEIPVEATRERIWFPDEIVAPTFSAEPTLARLREAQARGTLVIGPYLPAYVPTFSPAFGEWLDGHRSVVEAQVRKALMDAADEHRLRGEWAEREALAREVLRIDPMNQSATHARAECAAMVGAVTEALAILRRYEAELGPAHGDLARPTVALRRQIAEHFPARRYRIPSDRCFVGREALMSVLTVALLRARNREGSAILLWGPPGIGKTRLAVELTGLAVVQGLRVVRVQCEESDARQPMAAFVDAVPQLLRLPGSLGVSPDAMPFLRRLTEFDPTMREPSPEARDPQYLAGRIRQAIVDLVDAVAGEGPLLLVFEDVHWMDASSWTTLRTLIEWDVGKPVLILLTSRRPHATAAPPQREIARLDLREVGALDNAASAALVRAIADDYGAPLPPDAEAWCGSVGEGNPLFLRELAVHCLEGGQPPAVPPSVQTLLDARIARLRPAAKRVLQASAVLAEHSTVDRLDRVLEMTTHDLLGALDELAEAALVENVGTLVRPRHELVAARIGAVTSDAARRLLHRRAAIVLEAEVSGGAAIDLMWACAGHWQATGDAGRGLRLALSAANQMIEIGAPNNAVEVCNRAAPLCSCESDEFDLLRTKATALSLAGQYGDACTLLADLLAKEHNKVPYEIWAADVLATVDAETRVHGFDSVAAETVCTLAGDPQLDSLVRVRAALVALRIAENLGDKSIASRTWESVRDIESSDPEVRSRRLLVDVMYHLSVGEIALGCAATLELTAIQRRERPSYSSIGVLMNLAEAASICGNLRLAFEHATAAFNLSVQYNADYAAAWAACSATEIALARREAKEASWWFALASARTDQLKDRITTSTLRALTARILLLRGEVDAAYVVAAAHVEACRAEGLADGLWTRSALTTLVECCLESGSQPVERSLLDALADVHQRRQSHPLHDRTARTLFKALERAGRADEAHALAIAYLRHRRGGPIELSELIAGSSDNPTTASPNDLQPSG